MTRRPWFARHSLLALGLSFALSACVPTGLLDDPGAGGAPPLSGEVLGTGPYKVTMLLPLSATGGPGTLAREMRNAADLALKDFPNAPVQIVIKDDRGTTDGARVVASAAVTEGNKLLLGPVFGEATKTVGSIARPSNIPVISFSKDAAAASKGVYLMGFVPQNDVRRIVGFASGRGKKSFAALLPATSYGTIVEANLKSAAAQTGGQVIAVEKYNSDPNSIKNSVAAVVTKVKQGIVNTVFVPESGPAATSLAAAFKSNGVSPAQVQLLGSSLWINAPILRDPNFSGAWFPAPDLAGHQAFVVRYKAAYGAEPSLSASLAYDAVSLAAGLTSRFGEEAFTEKVLTNKNGFKGVDGIFRFLTDGLNQRALAVYQVEREQLGVISPAPQNFNSGF